MNRFIWLIINALALWSAATWASTIETTDGTPSETGMSAILKTPGASTYSRTFTQDDALLAGFELTIDPQDVGQRRSLYLAGLYDGRWFMLDQQRNWQPWDGDWAHLTAFDEKVLSRNERFIAFDNAHLPSGEFVLYGGYSNDRGGIIHNREALGFFVFDSEAASLMRFHTEAMLKHYVAQSQRAHDTYRYDTAWPLPMPEVANGSTSLEARISTTNLQEAGIDEADIVKTDDDRLYVLDNCRPNESPRCIKRYRLSEDPAASEPLDSTVLPDEIAAEGLYLRRNGASQPATLISIGSHRGLFYPFMADSMRLWHDPHPWQNSRSDILFYRLDADKTSLLHRVTLDGTLISSRRIGDTLYLVTRSTPTETEPLPTISLDDDTRRLVDANHCYLPPASASQNPEASLITITAIDIDDPRRFTARCLVGATETFYMSPRNLYLATTQYAYFNDGIEPWSLTVPRYQADHRTQIHKFSLDALAVDYRGSGEVKGHLGWEENKKPFRFGEHGDILRVATSLGEDWNLSASTRVTLFKEDRQRLIATGHLDNLGKPGERLYAARFIEDRGFLVTFRMTDPLYVLDLSDPAQPTIAGELEIDGYSDYLHPLGDDYLLGIGKDAIPDDTEASDDQGRGAWYQGVKLSLFDIRDLSRPLEIDQAVLGKRGSESDVLYDHHALAYLPPTDRTPARIAIPVRVHEGLPRGDGRRNDTFYEWSHTGLHVFDIDVNSMRPTLTKAGQIITEQAPASPSSHGYGQDRAVLQGSSAHYIHSGAIHSERFAQTPN